MSYQNPKLCQMLAKVIFKDDHLSHAKFFDVVPKIRENGLNMIEVDQIRESDATSAATNGELVQPTWLPRVKCWDPGRDLLVQLLPDIMIINQVGNHSGWTDFKDFFMSNFACASGALEQLQFRSLRLNTLYKLATAEQDCLLGLNVTFEDQQASGWEGDSNESIDIRLDAGSIQVDNKDRRLKVQVIPMENQFLIQVFCTVHNKNLTSSADIEKIMDTLHFESNGSFESIATDTTNIRLWSTESNGKSAAIQPYERVIYDELH